jgi:LPPG:FO 2-phospho-L-lactate transferase
MIAALAGGVGAAKFLAGLVCAVDPAEVTAIVNVADDETFHGLHVSPDLDSVTYALAGENNTDLGWGRAGETFRTIDELARFGDSTWFRLGDLDLATHLFRTERLATGQTLTEVTADVARGFGIVTRILPVTDDRLRTIIRAGDPPQDYAMQEWFVRERCEPAVESIRFDGVGQCRPTNQVLDSIRGAEAIVICPSNPIISIEPVLAVPGLRDAIAARRNRTIAVSPIVGGKAVKGPAGRLMEALGIEVSALGVARRYREFCSAIVIDEVDASLRPAIEELEMRVVVADTMMIDIDVATELATITLGAMP